MDRTGLEKLKFITPYNTREEPSKIKNPIGRPRMKEGKM